jgi:hypothetical protein
LFVAPPYGEPRQKAFKDWNTGWNSAQNDNENSWEITEPGIYYQAAYTFLLGYFCTETPDTDFDQMPDAWERTHFGNILRDGTGDRDGDGVTDGAEYIGGTDPTNRLTVMAIRDMAWNTSAHQRVLWWPSATGRLYSVRATTNPASASWPFVAGATNLPGTGATMSGTNNSPASVPEFYRLSIRVAE